MVQSILIIKPSSLGDILHAMPAVEALRRQFPSAGIDWVVNDGMEEILNLVPTLRRVIKFPRKSWSRIFNFIVELRKEKYDLVIDFQGLLRSGIITWLAKGQRKIGFASAREGATLFYGEKFAIPDDICHAVDKNLLLVKMATGAQARIAECKDSERLPHSLSVCFSSRWESKDWPLDFLAEAINLAASEIPDLQVTLVGSKGDQGKGRRLAEMIHRGNVNDMTGKTSLMELAALLKRSSVMLTVDSGPMHIAAAVGTPCIALFGSTFPEKTGPYGKNHIVIRSKCPKAPCFKRTCPDGKNCAIATSPEEVAKAITQSMHR